MIFTCHVSGDEIEWGNTSSSNNRIRFDDDAPVGTSISQGVITATLTSKDSSGAKSDYIINVSPGAQFGYTRIYCEDRGDGGGEIQCPPTVITPGKKIVHNYTY